ncbi:hypothetical protein Leryth_008399 [Lithospermum erythrorhizon]|nr:hypothetical protein Leryth_008399 [Lithospermum erythrorhizon]
MRVVVVMIILSKNEKEILNLIFSPSKFSSFLRISLFFHKHHKVKSKLVPIIKQLWGSFIVTSLEEDIMANAASGMAVDDECKLKFLELKSKRNYRFIIFKIEGQQVVVEKLGSPEESYDDFPKLLSSRRRSVEIKVL